MSEPDLYEALNALRDAREPFATHLDREWRVVWRTLQSFGPAVGHGTAVDREDALSESLLKVRGGIRNLAAADEAGARRWLRRIYENTLRDLARKRRRLAEHFDGSRGDGVEGVLSRTASDEPGPEEQATAPAFDATRLADLEEMLFHRIDEHLGATVRAHARPNARRRAEVAYESLVRERSTEDLLATLPGLKMDTLYQWVHRGRDGVLLPVVERWARETADATDPDVAQEARFAAELAGILRSRIRRDAGKPRPQRKKEPREG